MDPEPNPEARVIVNGEPVESSDALFIGSLEHARDFVAELSPAQRAEVSIWTEGQVYSPTAPEQ